MESRTITETPPARPAAQPPGESGSTSSWWRGLLSSPLVISTVACLALAALSAAIFPTVPSYDPWSWIVWGRELVNPQLGFSTGGGPSWKPFPVIFTAVYGLVGGASPTLWVITARAGGLLSLVAAYRLAARLTARGVASDVIGAVGGRAGRREREATRSGATRAERRWRIRGVIPAASGPADASSRAVTPGERWMGAVAGVLAAIGVALTQEWAYYMFRGTSEPMLVGVSLWAVDRHLSGRRGSAFLLGVAAALIRPEAWPFIAIYGVWLWLREPRLRLLVLVGWLSIPVLWFVPPWISSGDPLLASVHAKEYNGHLGKHPFFEVLRRGADLQVLPALVFAIIGTAIAWLRDRDRLMLGLAAAAAGWWVLVVAMTIDGYPGLERFYLPAAGLICVLAGVGVVRVGELVASWLQGRGMQAGSAALATAGVVAVLVIVSIPLTTSRISEARAQNGITARAVTRLNQLSDAVAAVGGHAGVYPCKASFSAVNHGVQTALAWKLRANLTRVGTSMRHSGVMFVGPHDSIDGAPPRIDPRITQQQLIAHVGDWKVYRATVPDHTSCVGR